MKNNIIFRILGALASALIIIGVFVPFVSVSGFSESLWGTYDTIGTLYLPIMIIVFGVIGVLFFSLNVKTEFAYMSTGAILFFVIMQTLDIIEQNMFSSLSMGYYFLCIGALMTGLMAFLCNLRRKKEIVIQQQDSSNGIQPMTIQSIPEVQPAPVQPIPEVQPAPMQPISEVQPAPMQPIPEVQPAPMQSIPEVQPAPMQQNLDNAGQDNNNIANPILEEFEVLAPGGAFGLNPQTQQSAEISNQLQSDNSSNNANTDIFGQPINK